MSDTEYAEQTFALMVEDWRLRGADSPFAYPETWLENRQGMLDALDGLRATRDVQAFNVALGRLPRTPDWVRRGAHRMFLSTIADRSTDDDPASIVLDAYTAPNSVEEAVAKIGALFELASTTDRASPPPAFAPLAASVAWCMQDPDRWPPGLSGVSENVLVALRLLRRTATPGERYQAYVEALWAAPHPPLEVATALDHVRDEGWRALSPGLYGRLGDNARMLQAFDDAGYTDDQEAEAEANIGSAIGELELLGKGLVDEASTLMVRDFVVQRPQPRIGFSKDVPFRADAYVDLAVGRERGAPSLRIWATPSGLAIGARLDGSRRQELTRDPANELVAGGLTTDLSFFRIAPHKDGDRLVPFDEPQPNDVFVGRWIPGGLTGTSVGDEALATFRLLQPVFDVLARASGERTAIADSDDPLSEAVDAFLHQTGYPTDADATTQAEREQMAEVVSEVGLLGFDLQEFRRIFNTGRYGGPGPQAGLNTSLNRMTPEDLDAFADNLEFLLRGSPPLEERVAALMDLEQRGVKGFGEAVITKLLAIEYPHEIIPVFVYRGPKGKGTILKLLDLHEDGLDGLDPGPRLVRSNDHIRSRLAPFFGDDMWGMARFVYWYAERDEASDEADEIDRIGTLADVVLVDRDALDEVVALIEDKGQVIFYGPPGTGKTYLARELAKALAPEASQRMLVQFHPSTSYEDFFEGFRPDVDTEGRLTYRLVKGPLALIADRARENPLKQHVLVVDEINRANLPKVFGELLFLLEYRDESIRSLYRPDEPFELPKNLWLIGTMNTADRSIALVDAAMRRRFHFVPFFPNEGLMVDLLRRWLAAHDQPEWVADLLDMVNDELRERLGGPHLQIGPSHFMRRGVEESIERIWAYSVRPYIEEQLYGDQAAIREYEYPRVKKRFDAKGVAEDEAGEDGDDHGPPSGVG